jgi:hypothetical protein
MSNMETNRTDGSRTATRDPSQVRMMTPDKIAGAGAFAESLAGVAAVTLAILALAGVVPVAFAGIATIVVGTALVLEGAVIAKRLRDARARAGLSNEAKGGVSAEALAGVGGIVLGILYLAGAGAVLLPVAILVLGAGSLFGSIAVSRVNAFPVPAPTTSEAAAHAVRESGYVAEYAHIAIGVGAVVLGIIALTGGAPFLLCLIALLAIGGSEALSGGAIGSRFINAPSH